MEGARLGLRATRLNFGVARLRSVVVFSLNLVGVGDPVLGHITLGSEGAKLPLAAAAAPALAPEDSKLVLGEARRHIMVAPGLDLWAISRHLAGVLGDLSLVIGEVSHR